MTEATQTLLPVTPEGPRITVKASCFDCPFVVSESYRVQSDSGSNVYCAHPSFEKRQRVGDTVWDTPDFCPVADIPAIRAAVAEQKPAHIAPCRVCGGAGTVHHYHGIAINGWTVECDLSNEIGDGSHASGRFPTKAEAITAWNARSQSHSLPGDVGTVRPLKWNEPHPSASYPQWSAQFFGMRFEARIDTSRASCFGKFPLAINGLDAGQKFETVDAAKAYAQEQFETRIRDLMAAALAPSALSPEPVQKVHELPEGHRWCRHCEQKDPHCSVCEGVGYLPPTLFGELK